MNLRCTPSMAIMSFLRFGPLLYQSLGKSKNLGIKSECWTFTSLCSCQLKHKLSYNGGLAMVVIVKSHHYIKPISRVTNRRKRQRLGNYRHHSSLGGRWDLHESTSLQSQGINCLEMLGACQGLRV